MLKLLPYLKKYAAVSVLAPLFKMFEAIFELIVPLVVAKMIDVGVAAGDSSYVWRTGALLAVFGVAGWIFGTTAQYFSARAGMGFGKEVRKALFRHINRLSFSEYNKQGATTLITRLVSDCDQAQDGLNRFLRLFLRAPFIVFGALIASFVIDYRMGLIFLGATLLTGGVIFLITYCNLPNYTAIQKNLDGVSGSIRENLEGMRVIRAFCNEQEEEREFNAQADRLKERQTRAGAIAALHNPLTLVVINVAIVALLWFGGGFVDIGELTQGEITALINYMLQIMLALTALSHLILLMTKGIAGSKRIAEVLALPVEDRAGEIPDPPKEGEALAEFEGVRFCYHAGAEAALDGVDLTIYKGETVGVIGGTGSGKSALVHLLPAFYRAEGGEVRFFGLDVGRWDKEALRARIGLVDQRAALFRGTVRENLLWGKADATEEELWKALECAEARAFVEEKGEGLEMRVEQGGRNLSGGQRQRLTIARALLRKPDLLILDDAFSALDFATEARIRKNLAEAGLSVLMVGQRAAALRHADRILVLENGTVAGCGTHAQLWEHCAIYREICLSQLSAEETGA